MSNPTYYETMYILRPDIPEDEVENHLKKYSEVLEKAKAVIIDNQMRGKRRLAYSIGKHKEGIYVQLSHTGEGNHVEALERTMRLSEDVIRYLTVKQYGPLPAKRTPKTSEKESVETNEKKETKEANTKAVSKEESKKPAKEEKKETNTKAVSKEETKKPAKEEKKETEEEKKEVKKE